MPQQDGQGRRSQDAGITRRELEVVRLIAEGLSCREAAERMCRSPRTVENHLRSVYHKLGVRNRIELLHKGRELGLLEIRPDPHAKPAAEMELKAHALEVLAGIDRRLAAAPREGYFGELVLAVAAACATRWAGIGALTDGGRGLDVVALASDGALAEQAAWPLAESACAELNRAGTCVVHAGVRSRFPRDSMLSRFGAEAFMGVRLDDRFLGPIGALWLMHDVAVEDSLLHETILRLFAPRAAAELALAMTLHRL